MTRSKEVKSFFKLSVRGLKLDNQLGVNESGSAFNRLVGGFVKRGLNPREAIQLAKKAEKKAGFRRGK